MRIINPITGEFDELGNGVSQEYVDTIVSSVMKLQGDWNASTNTPNISSTTKSGYTWRVSVDGSTNIGGITDWKVGDMVVKTGTGWIKIDNTESSVPTSRTITINGITQDLSADRSWTITDSSKLPLAGGTMTGKTTTAGTSEVAKTYTPSSGSQTVTIDCSLNNIHEIACNNAGTTLTLAVSNVTNSQVFMVAITQGSTTLSTIAGWFSTIRWVGGTAPTFTATLNKRDVFGFRRTGTNTYDGFIIGQNI